MVQYFRNSKIIDFINLYYLNFSTPIVVLYFIQNCFTTQLPEKECYVFFVCSLWLFLLILCYFFSQFYEITYFKQIFSM